MQIQPRELIAQVLEMLSRDDALTNADNASHMADDTENYDDMPPLEDSDAEVSHI